MTKEIESVLIYGCAEKLLLYLYVLNRNNPINLRDQHIIFSEKESDVVIGQSSKALRDIFRSIQCNPSDLMNAIKYLEDKELISCRQEIITNLGDTSYRNFEMTSKSIDLLEKIEEKEKRDEYKALFNLNVNFNLESLISGRISLIG